jgi:hypothetical protein
MPIDLSAKKYYTFPELASRLQCSEQDLRYWVMEGELTPSSYFRSGENRQYLMEPDENYGTTGTVSPCEMYDIGDSVDVRSPVCLIGFHYLVFPTRTSVNQCEFHFAATLSSGFDYGDIIYGLAASIDIDKVIDEGVVMAVELDRFVAVKSKTRKPNGLENPLATIEHNSLLKLVIGMAIKGYAHDPAASKSTSPKEIADDLAQLGISITDDTVRKHLKKAAATVLPAKQRPQ